MSAPVQTSETAGLRCNASLRFAGLARAIPFAIAILFLAVAPLTEYSEARGWRIVEDARWLYAVQSALAAAAIGLLWRFYAELAAPPRAQAGYWLLALVCGALVFLLWIWLDHGLLVLGTSGEGFVPLDADGRIIWGLVAIRLAGAVIIVPIAEELFWRSFVLRWIDKPDFLSVRPQQVSLRAMLLSSVVFGLAHSLWLAGIIAGLAYAALYRLSGNLWVAVLAHAVSNLMLGVWVVVNGNWDFW